jgi:stage V sporulation protein G
LELFWQPPVVGKAFHLARRLTVDITEVRIKLMEDPGERLKAFCSITFDNCFVVRDLKIIDGSNGPFVAMPSRKLTAHCSRCGMKNHLRAQHCNQCGGPLSQDRMPLDAEGRAKLYADIAHPINSACRELIQDHVITEYFDEIERSKQPGYVSRYDDVDIDFHDDFGDQNGHRQRESRVDRPHGRGGPHESQSSQSTTAQRHTPTPKLPPAPPSKSTEGFGSGIFPDA